MLTVGRSTLCVGRPGQGLLQVYVRGVVSLAAACLPWLLILVATQPAASEARIDRLALFLPGRRS